MARVFAAWWVWLSLASLPAACTPGGPDGNRQPGDTEAGSANSTSVTAGAAAGGSVFVIMLENAGFDEVMSTPYLASLANRYAVATDYHAVARPSLPNYLALTSGRTWDIADDAYHPLPDQGLGRQLTEAGVSWRAYMEGMSRGCLDSPEPYAVKHNPFAYYGGACPPNVVRLEEQLAADLAGATPRFVWITPDLCHDGHDCPLASADRWLAQIVPTITASAGWRRNGVLYVVFDEGSLDSNRTALLIVAPNLRRHRLDGPYTHYSLLAAIEDRLGVARLGGAAGAIAVADGTR